jgi:hypothetical protein
VCRSGYFRYSNCALVLGDSHQHAQTERLGSCALQLRVPNFQVYRPPFFQGGPPSPTWRTSDANEESVWFSPAFFGLYGKADATISWAAEKRKSVAEGIAEPIDSDLSMFGCR